MIAAECTSRSGRQVSADATKLSTVSDEGGKAPGSNSKKRRRADRDPSPSSSLSSDRVVKCSFCGDSNAAVIVGGLVEKPLCLLHYYTTRACRVETTKVRAAGGELELQLPDVQDLFAEAFTELQQEIAEESARALQASSSDPLSVLRDVRRRPRTKGARPAAPLSKSVANASNDGGFIRSVALPERLQKQQRRQREAEEARMAEMSRIESNPYKRRKPTKASIWNLALSVEGRELNSAVATSWNAIERAVRPSVTCSCGSTEVESDGNVTGRNEDVAKAETWGTKDRSEVITRCRCLRCGKTWNEED